MTSKLQIAATEVFLNIAGYLVKTRDCPRSGLCTVGASGSPR
jgi:hypothetical protein